MCWLFGPAYKMGLLKETIFITVSLIDRYVMRQAVRHIEFQLVGIAALHVACKY